MAKFRNLITSLKSFSIKKITVWIFFALNIFIFWTFCLNLFNLLWMTYISIWHNPNTVQYKRCRQTSLFSNSGMKRSKCSVRLFDDDCKLLEFIKKKNMISLTNVLRNILEHQFLNTKNHNIVFRYHICKIVNNFT